MSTERERQIDDETVRRFVDQFMAGAEASGNPESYWQELISLVSSSCAAHLTHDAAAKALAGSLWATRCHQAMEQQPKH